MPLGTVGGLTADYNFHSREYEFRVTLLRTTWRVFADSNIRISWKISVDGERLLLETVGGDVEAGRTGTITEKSDVTDARLRVRVPIAAGPHEVAATFVRKIGEGTNRLRPFDRSNADTYESIGRPHVETLTVLGPFLAERRGRHAKPPSHLHLQARQPKTRKRTLRPQDSLHACATCVPAAGDGRRSGPFASFL